MTDLCDDDETLRLGYEVCLRLHWPHNDKLQKELRQVIN